MQSKNRNKRKKQKKETKERNKRKKQKKETKERNKVPLPALTLLEGGGSPYIQIST